VIVLVAVVLAVSGGGGSTATTGATKSTPKKAPPTADLAATYSATIDTGGTLKLTLSGTRSELVHLAINMPLSCADGTDDTFRTTFLSPTDTQAIDPDGTFTFKGTADADTFITGGRVTVTGRLETNGTGTGNARMVETSRQHGRCDSSIGRWTASGS
jgi:hypothetical protein